MTFQRQLLGFGKPIRKFSSFWLISLLILEKPSTYIYFIISSHAYIFLVIEHDQKIVAKIF